MFRVNNKKKEKASGLFLACMPSKQHAPAPACHDKKQCRPYSYSRAGHAHVSAQPPLIDRSMVWKRKKKEEKKKRSHIRNVDGLHTGKVSSALWRSAGRTPLAWSHAPLATSPARCTITGSPHVLQLACTSLDQDSSAASEHPIIDRFWTSTTISAVMRVSYYCRFLQTGSILQLHCRFFAKTGRI